MGRDRYPDADRLLIRADAGGSNGYRVRAWKVELAKLAAETGLSITVGHFPPGTSKWNKIEHRMFSFITMNWRGAPHLLSPVIELISTTTTTTGLKINADSTRRVSDRRQDHQRKLAAVPLTRHEFQGAWNYTVHAQSSSP